MSCLKGNGYYSYEFFPWKSVFLLLSAACSNVSYAVISESWHVGCYPLSSLYVNAGGNFTQLGTAENPVDCGRQCLDTGFPYTAVHPNGCLCVNNTPPAALQLPPETCNFTCAYNASGVVASDNGNLPHVQYIPCGGTADTASVYLSNGPYLYNVSLSITDDTVYVGQAFVITILVNFAGNPNMELGFASEVAVLPTVVYIQSFCGVGRLNVLRAHGKTVSTDVICIEETEGNHSANATVLNILGEVSSAVFFSILTPKISTLNVLLLSDQTLLPSCSPDLDLSNGTQQKVFEGVPMKFEASVDVRSNNVVFNWTFMNSDLNVVVFNVSLNGVACHDGQSCTISIQEYTFPSGGYYSIYVTASNDISEVAADMMKLVVVAPGVHNVTFNVETLTWLPGEEVGLAISIGTMMLQRMILIVDFGDGSIRRMGFRSMGKDGGGSGTSPINSDSEEPSLFGNLTLSDSPDTTTSGYNNVSDPDWEELEMMGTYSYSQNCQLSFLLEHIYFKEGSYQPVMSVSDGLSNISLHLDDFLTVANKLKSVSLNHSTVETVNHSVAFSATTDVPSIFLSFSWLICLDGLPVFENVTDGSVVYHAFSEAGKYEISVNASNPTGSVFAKSTIFIEELITNLQLSCLPYKYIAIYQDLNCSATIDSGSNVNFHWNFYDSSNSWIKVWNTDLISIAQHRFYSVGEYSVSVNVSNSLNQLFATLPYRIVVLEPVSNLWTLLPMPVLLGEAVTFLARTGSGSSVVFKFYFGDSSDHVVINGTCRVNVSVTHMYAAVGTYQVTVSAQNEVTQLRKKFDVDILMNIPSASVQVVGPAPAVWRPTVLAVHLNGELSLREDLIYNWSKDGSIFSVTQSPVNRITFDVATLYNISVVVCNLVVIQSTWTVVNVTDEKSQEFFIEHSKDVLTYGVPSVFKLVNQPQGNIIVDYGDNSSEEINSTGIDQRVEHIYSQPGIYVVLAKCQGQSGQLISTSTVAEVQQMLTSLVISGPEVLPMSSLAEPREWLALAANGTRVVYVWRFDDVVIAVTAKSKVYMAPSIGEHMVSVTATNGISSLKANLSVFVQSPVISAAIKINDVTLGSDTYVHITVVGDGDVNVTCYFGDGTIATNTSNLFSSVDPLDYWNEEVPTSHRSFSHKYSSVGVYSVLVNVTNRVSWLMANSTAWVCEPVGDISMTTASPLWVPSGSVVMVTALTMASYNLTFNWTSQQSVCASQFDYDGIFWKSTANCSLLATAGLQSVIVNVSSAITGNWKLENMTFVALDPVYDLVLLASSSPTETAVLRPDAMCPGCFYTDPVRFEARLSRGSGVSCSFNFGDNSSEQVVTDERLGSSSSTRCIVTHVFRKAGAFRVNVTAYNQISQLSSWMIFYVQVPPSGLHLAKDPEPYRTQKGLNVVFIANITSGTNVTYSWLMGDGNLFSSAGANVTYRYSSLGCFFVTVTAHNRVGSTTAAASVFVQDYIQSVELVANLPLTQTGIAVQSGASVSFTAIPHPNVRCLVDGYEWKPLRDPKDLKEISYPTVSSQFNYTYRKLGTFSATVTARNTLSQLTSEPLIVSVIDKMEAVKIFINSGETVINSQIELNAYHYGGSSVTYTWNFGDNETATSAVSEVKHTYTSVGVFSVCVNATNAISQESANLTIFITRTFCKPPVVMLLGPQDIVYWKSKDVRIEASIIVNCSITNVTIYSWNVMNTISGASVDLRGFMFHDPSLYLPKGSLPYGNYSVQLHVAIADTVVYSETEVPYGFSVEPSPLQGIIQGGLMRNVSYDESIVLDGLQSYDPDFPEANDLIYNWSCVDFRNRDKPCFTDNQLSAEVSSFSGGQLKIPGFSFRQDASDFLFEMTVSKPDRSSNSSVQQLLVFQHQPAIDVSIVCDDCTDLLVNSNDQLVFQALHFGFQEKDLEYRWTLSDINVKGSYIPAQSLDSQQSCIPMDGLTWNLFANGSATNSSMVEAEEPKSAQSHQLGGSVTPVPLSVASFDGSSALSEAKSSPQSTSWDADSGHMIDMPSSSLSSTLRTSTPSAGGGVPVPGRIMADEGNSGGRNIARRLPPIPPVDKGSPAGRPLPPQAPADFGKNIGKGDGKGRSEGLTQLEAWEHLSEGRGPIPRGPMQSAQKQKSEEELDQAIDRAHMYKDKDEIFTVQRHERKLLPHETKTGVNQRILVINPNVLTQGMQYVLRVTVKHKGGNYTGTSVITFRVNESPSHGQCSLNADAINGGTEMQTDFNLYCRGWRDEDLPVSYEVTYRLSAESQSQIIYHGLNGRVQFRLPAGDPSNYSVIVEVAVIDSLGARTGVCVSSLVIQQAVVDEQRLYAQIKENGTITSFVQKGNNPRVRLSAFMAAHLLNRLPSITNETTQEMRRSIRTLLLSYIYNLPIRDKYEVQQSISALAELTSVVNEINEDGVSYASFLLKQICNYMSRLQAESGKIDPRTIDLALGSISDLLSWLLGDETTSLHWRKKTLSRSMEYIEMLLLVKADQLFPDTEAMNQSTSALSTYAARFSVGANPDIFLDAMRLRLPFLQGTGSQLLASKDRTDLSNLCFESNVVLYKENPFIFGPQPTEFITTNVVSVTMYSCNGLKLAVGNLTKDQALDVNLPSKIYSHYATASNVYYLSREFMNMHVFNLTSSDWEKDNLHIDVEFLPLQKSARVFPVSVFLQVDSEPSLNSYMFEWDVHSPRGTSSFVINLAAMKMEGDRSFSLCLVEQTLNGVRPRPDQVKNLSYYLNIWWGQCLYWDADIEEWSTTGCYLDNSSSFQGIRCRCNHLTSYGANVHVYSSEARQIDVSLFFSMPLNPVTCAVLPSLLLIYCILLFIASKLDAHDHLKLPVVSLVDNSIKDRQRYYMTLETGFRQGAGTTAKVSVVLHGEYGMSETRELISRTGQPLFERNSRDTFYMTFPESLGSIFKVQLWHDNSGSSPSWYLSRVTVKDACTGDIYYFVCERWFAVEKEDGKVEREIMAADKGLSFSTILSAKSMQYLTDYHLWFSTLVKPSYSRFTRAQRLTCCLCLLMSYMALSSAWYQYVGPPYRGEFSLIDISWQSIIVGIIIGVIVLPPTLFIILIFRRSKVYRSKFEETNEEFGGKEDSHFDPSEQPLSEDHRLGGATGLSVFEQTMLSWQNLQDWAQKAWAKRYQQSPVGSVQNVKPVAIQNVEPAVAGRETMVTSDVKRTSDVTGCKPLELSNDVAVGSLKMEPVASSREPVGQTLMDGVEQADVLGSSFLPHEAGGLPNENGGVMELRKVSDNVECSNEEKFGKTVEKQENPEEIFSRQEVSRMKFRLRSKGSSCNTSPSSSFFDSSPKEVRRFAQDDGLSEGGFSAPPLANAPLQPPSYGVIHHSGGASRSSSTGMNSNRSSVKSASSNCTRRIPFKKWRHFLPHYFVYIGWSLSVLLITGCAAVTIYYGYRFSPAQSILWLQSVFFSFLQCIFISHPIIVVAIMFYSAVRYRNDMSIFDHYGDGLIHDNATQKAKELSDDGEKISPTSRVEQRPLTLEQGIAARQRSRYLRFARPPQEQRLIEARHQTMKETNASALINETVLFVGQFLLLVFIAFGKETETSYQLRNSLSKSFTSDGEFPFVEVSSINQWWGWLNKHFLETMYREDGYVDNCYLIGLISLRQLRVKDVNCYISTESKLRCRDIYDQAHHEMEPLIRNGTHYEYVTSDKSGSCDLNGQFGSYSGGGYIVYLDRTDRSKAEEQLRQLEQSNWTDQYTGAIILQFTLFHPQSSLLATVSLLIEIPPLGAAFISNHIAVVYLYKYITAMDNLVLACELLFFLATMLKIHHEIIQVLHHGINYLKNIWNVLEVSQCLLSLALIICYTYRFLLIDTLVEKFRSTYLEEFVDVSNLAYWDQVLRSLTGFVLLLINLQLVKGLRHHQPFARFTNVYNHTSVDFVVFGCMFVIWMGAYVSLGIALFGGFMWEMTSISQAVGYMTGLYECSYEFPMFKGLSPSELAIWEVYTMSFLLLAYGTNAGYLLAFLTFHYRVFKDEPVLVFNPRESFAYYCNKLLNFFARKSENAYEKQKEVILPPEFTMAEIQYQVDEMLFKMNALAGTSNLPEKPAMYFTDSDTTYVGVGEELSSSAGSSGEGNFEHWLHRMKENLFRNDPHFAQLVNCDTHTAKQEGHKQLMQQLEMEILRKLQSKRSSNNHLSESGTSTNNGGEGMKEEGRGTGAMFSSVCKTSSTNTLHAEKNTTLPVTGRHQSEYLVASGADQRHVIPKEFGIVSLHHHLSNPGLELQNLNQLHYHATEDDGDDDDDDDDDTGCPSDLVSGSVMETVFGSDTVRQLLVPPHKIEGRKELANLRLRCRKLGKVPSWTSSGGNSMDDSVPSPVDQSPDVKGSSSDAFPSQTSPLPLSTDDLEIAKEGVFGFENEGYVLESSSEDSDEV